MDMLTRARNSLFGATQPRNLHSLDNLKYLYGVLQRNTTVSDANRDLLTETLRSISEILIWGDQHDSSVFDYFLERGMLIYFLDYMRQKNGRFICVQILQTLNILFENIRNETSLYYLLSNNHVNRIILHKFDFSDEEITAYYISFLKTLSLKLNKHSINFFYNERNNDFPLYVEAIKFFNHPETMVRIAVRTLTLNVYKVSDPGMHRFILDCTATEYFSNFVWFIRNHVLDFDGLIRNNRDINHRGQLTSSLEEYLDHIHYLQDIFLLNVDSLNNVLKDQLMNRLLIPVYIFSLIKRDKFSRVKDPRIMLDQLSTLFLLAEVFLVIHYRPVVEELADIILSVDVETVEAIQHRYGEQISYSLPPASLEVCLAKYEANDESDASDSEVVLKVVDINDDEERRQYEGEHSRLRSASSSSTNHQTTETHIKPASLYVSNWTDDEKYRRTKNPMRLTNAQIEDRPYFNALIKALECTENDQLCFYALSVLLTMTTNPAVDSVIIESVCLTVKSSDKSFYNVLLVDKLCDILELATIHDSNIRIVTLSLAISLLKKLVYDEEKKISYLSDHNMARIDQARKQATTDLRRYYPQQELLLDMFEDEYRQTQLNPLRIEHLLKDSCMLFPPSTTPLSGVEFIKRLPSGDIERARRSIRVFFLVRALFLELNSIAETELPLTKPENLLKLNDKIDFHNCDLIACTVHMTERKDRRFLVIDQMQFILIEPDGTKISWGIVKFCDLMQDVEVANDKEDSRSLHITIHKPVANIYVKTSPPILNAKFTFDDHIRCMTAKQNLNKGRQRYCLVFA
ncbi:unnamed protein product [Rotaria socialis]|uniref:FPL domain-containing protein n=1 Tax=Rotaria socialis TaxID=392032 RepID=A0A817U1F3_9BILA|nr:unnamed protein product [Rotaria socialis]CAF3447634.1 unnamed protein product [Rotaria socialis]CAF3530173.1 unnamed protein product [Rotaria socialis]CAF4388061.1 unnamed protein product [Rotaria socialis]CAF4477700.1 unnamed protein product [Rotaria socialis]